MSEINKSYRINTNIGNDLNNDYITIDANLVQDYETFDILSVKIDSVDTYKLHNANYGVVVGRVLANNGFGIPNAKLSIFISSDGEDGEKVRDLYPFSSTASKDRKGVRYNLLPNEQVDDCHQIVGTFPSKRYALDNDVVLEVFDKYYKYTTRTNNAGDYLIMGVPVGAHTLHMDLDLSDCGILSQRPRDFVYKGYTIEQFENPNMFKSGTEYSNLSQIFTQDQVVNVQPFWGNTSLGEKIGITRADINVAFKFEPTCVFIGSVISDNSSQGISKKCIATENMGNMEELTTGEGTIEMIRKTPNGAVEEFQVKGAQLIDGNGIWCYQIPMNLDYMMTDEYGNMVPTDDPEKGIPTRTKVRFRISMQDNEENVDNFFRAKVLVPHNPQNLDGGKHEEYDYEFGSLTRDDSFRDLFWNNVYSVKSYIPRFQKRLVGGWKEKKFTGIKNCNFYGSNNPMPYNNIRIKLPFIFTVMCALIKIFIFVISIVNSVISMIGNMLSDIGNTTFFKGKVWQWIGVEPWTPEPFKKIYNRATTLSMNVLKEGLCPDLENWYFAPMFDNNLWSPPDIVPQGCSPYDLLNQTLNRLRASTADDDPTSIDYQNNEERDSGEEPICLTIHTDYLISCVEMNLAMEYKVINFDFYNDWINGTIYFPRFMRYIRPKKKFLGITFLRSKVKGCMDDPKIFSKTRRYTQQCALGFKNRTINGSGVFTEVENPMAKKINIKVANNLHKQRGLSQKSIFGKNGGICHEQTTMHGQYVYYMKPCEWTIGTSPDARKVNLFATDIILLGSLNACDLNGIPQAYKYLSSTSYIMPSNLALTNMENNGYLYAMENGVICAGKAQLTEDDIKKDSKIRIVDPNSGLTSEIAAFSGARDSNYNVQYDGKELSDIIALTESAGIAWNYTGPGQGEMDAKSFYYPGGHFLGLSCVNSQTNIKSCINLSRICEVGANMSQRKEDISKIDSDGNVTYTYTAPTGFISGDDIVGENFRTMFATMNHKRLIAAKTNPSTGYKIYDFDFIRPTNFDGAFKSVTNSEKSKSLYNGKVEVPKEDETIWGKIGIDYNADSRPDHDQNEYVNTQTRTIEDTSVDYYLYRFGLNYADLKKTNQKHQRSFLITRGNKMYLPQYENSYYFYFGLKNGATALDEFNKQFFSECENGILLTEQPTIKIGIEGDIEEQICRGKVDASVVLSNIETPYQSIEITSDAEFMDGYGPNKPLVVINNDEEDTYDWWLTSYMFTLSACSFGTYNISIRDANDNIYTKTEKIGMDILSFNSTVYDFNTINYKKGGDLLFRGGYIEVSNVKIDALSSEIQLSVYIKGITGNINFTNNGEGTARKLGVDKPGEYELRVKYQCGDNTVDMLMQTFIVRDNSHLGLYMGDPNVSGIVLTVKDHNPKSNWWTNMDKVGEDWIQKVSTFNEIPEANKGKETSFIRVYAVGGDKAVWGYPQNAKEINKDKVCTSEDVAKWPNGYTLDDEYVYYPTFGPEDNVQFSALAHDGVMVMGDYEKTTTNGNGGPSKYLKNGYGYIFKPVPDGDLEFHVYNGSYTANTPTSGIFYSSVAYPSVNRPFYAKTRFYCWQRRVIEMVSNDNGSEAPQIIDYSEGGRTEMVIHNGVTYGKSFWKGSFVDNIDSIPSPILNDISGAQNNNDRLTEFKKLLQQRKLNLYGKDVTTIDEGKYIDGGTSGITSYGYEIIGGAPDDKSLQLCNSINDSVDALFGTYVKFIASGNGMPMSEAIAVGDSYGVAKYFIKEANQNDTNLRLITQSKGEYIFLRTGKKTIYACCTYTAPYPKNEHIDTEGSPVMVKITTDDNADTAVEKIKVMYPYTDIEGNVVQFNKTFKPKKEDKLNKGDRTGIVNILKYVFEKCTGIAGVKDYRILYNDTTKDEFEWESKIINSPTPTFWSASTAYFAYGVIESPNSDTKIYKIYPNPVRIVQPGEEDVNQLKLSISPSEVSLPYTKDAKETIKVVSFRQDKWQYKFVSDKEGSAKAETPDWLNVSVGDDGNSLIVKTTQINNGPIRTAYVKFYYEEDAEEGLVLTIQQLRNTTYSDPSNFKWTISDVKKELICDGKSVITFNGTGKLINLPTDKNRININIKLPSIKVTAPWSDDNSKFTFASSVDIDFGSWEKFNGPTYVDNMLDGIGIVSLGNSNSNISVDTTYTINIKVTSTEYPNTDIYEGYEKILLEIVT